MWVKSRKLWLRDVVRDVTKYMMDGVYEEERSSGADCERWRNLRRKSAIISPLLYSIIYGESKYLSLIHI